MFMSRPRCSKMHLVCWTTEREAREAEEDFWQLISCKKQFFLQASARVFLGLQDVCMYCPHSSPGCEQRKGLGRKQINPSPGTLACIPAAGTFRAVQGQGTALFPGPGQHSALVGGFTPLSQLCTQSWLHLMGAGAAGR